MTKIKVQVVIMRYCSVVTTGNYIEEKSGYRNDKYSLVDQNVYSAGCFYL